MIAGATELDRLVSRSRLIGANPELVVHGGGNTSAKILERDHLGRDRWVLRIKGSGIDLATIGPEGFPGLYLDELLPLRGRKEMRDEEITAYVARCRVEPESCRPSIETLLHAFLPARHVDHVHADAICALTNHRDAERAVREALGEDVAFVPYVRPGFELSKRVAECCEWRAAILQHHGVVTWGESEEAPYELTLEFVDRARRYLSARRRSVAGSSKSPLDGHEREVLLATLRGRLSREKRCVVVADESQRSFADRPDVESIAEGRATPDHLLHIGVRTAVVRDEDSVAAAVDAFEADYLSYFGRRSDDASEKTMHAPLPRVVLVPGLGCLAAGTEARVAQARAEVAARSHAVTATVLDAFGETVWLDENEIFDFEYWPVELYKLSLVPEPLELAGRIALITGAGSGIGRDVALDLAGRGAHVVLADVDADGLAETVLNLDPDRVVSVEADVGDEDEVNRVVTAAVESFGGIDAVVSNAGVGVTGRLADLPTEDWERSLRVNATSHFLLTRRVWPVLERQGIGGSLVYVASKNAFAPGPGFGAYSAAKAAEVQLARVAALEGGALGVRANVVNPDAVFAGSRLWSTELRRERAAAHGISVEELEDFYAKRSLLHTHVSGSDVAEAVAFLISDRSRATTGCVLTVDGGVAGAFPR